jgi:LPXTG-motif cell wall-anchored protein
MTKGHILALVSLVILLSVGLASISGESQAVSIGANPASIEANVVRGGMFEDTLTIFNMDNSTPMSCHVYTDAGFASWITFDQANFTVPPGERHDVRLIITPPSNGSSSNFTIYVQGEAQGVNGTPIFAGLKIQVSVQLTDPQTGVPIGTWLLVGGTIAVVAGIGLLVLRRKSLQPPRGKD